jgi:hypothetical protein
VKVGLWAALCYPGVDFSSLLVYEQERRRDGCCDENENEITFLICEFP